MHHGRALGEMGAQPHSIGVPDADAGRNHVVDHARELVHAEDGEMPATSVAGCRTPSNPSMAHGPAEVHTTFGSRPKMPSRFVAWPHEPMTEKVQPQVCVGGGRRWCVQIDFGVDDLGADFPSLVVDCRRDERDRAAAISPYRARRREVGVQHLTRAVDRCRPQPQATRNGAQQRQSWAQAYRRCKVPLVSAPLDLGGDVVELRALIDIESVSGHESMDAEWSRRWAYGHLEVVRDGNVVVARALNSAGPSGS